MPAAAAPRLLGKHSTLRVVGVSAALAQVSICAPSKRAQDKKQETMNSSDEAFDMEVCCLRDYETGFFLFDFARFVLLAVSHRRVCAAVPNNLAKKRTKKLIYDVSLKLLRHR